VTPREELLAAVAALDDQLSQQGEYAPSETGIIRDWLRLEADQHWHMETYGKPVNKWDLIWQESWVSMQPCIQMARLINGRGEV
jgi:hypothetical protein